MLKSVHIWSYSGPPFLSFVLNTERYSVSLRIESEYGKMRTRITLNRDTFYAVNVFQNLVMGKIPYLNDLKNDLKLWRVGYFLKMDQICEKKNHFDDFQTRFEQSSYIVEHNILEPATFQISSNNSFTLAKRKSKFNWFSLAERKF